MLALEIGSSIGTQDAELKLDKERKSKWQSPFDSVFRPALQFSRVIMVSIRLNRSARNRWRTVAVWAMLPLAVFNSRTVVGCGCTGHFESVCHCNCQGSSCCGTSHGTPCPCCQKQGKCHASETQRGKDSERTAGLHGHHCKGVAEHVTVPATVVSVHTADEVSVSAFTLDATDLSAATNLQPAAAFLSEHSTPPPIDRVVTLRRLVI